MRRTETLVLSVVLLSLVACTMAWARPGRKPAHGKRGDRAALLRARWMPEPMRTVLKKGERGKSSQGSELQGGTLEGSVVRGQIDSSRASAFAPGQQSFDGLRPGMRPFVVQVTAVAADPCAPPERPLALFTLDIDGQNPCGEASLAPDSEQHKLSSCEQQHWQAYRGKAMAVAGGWGLQMNFIAASHEYPISTFSCLSGVSAKCMRYGYHPWTGDQGTALYATCLRAARADYCGTGTSYTCSGTQIDLVDASDIQTRADDHADERLEADWMPDGARCLNTARLPGCGDQVEQARLLQVIAEECAAHHHPIAFGGCQETCESGPTCQSPLRTWMVTGQTNQCTASQTYCPAP